MKKISKIFCEFLLLNFCLFFLTEGLSADFCRRSLSKENNKSFDEAFELYPIKDSKTDEITEDECKNCFLLFDSLFKSLNEFKEKEDKKKISEYSYYFLDLIGKATNRIRIKILCNIENIINKKGKINHYNKLLKLLKSKNSQLKQNLFSLFIKNNFNRYLDHVKKNFPEKDQQRFKELLINFLHDEDCAYVENLDFINFIIPTLDQNDSNFLVTIKDLIDYFKKTYLKDDEFSWLDIFENIKANPKAGRERIDSGQIGSDLDSCDISYEKEEIHSSFLELISNIKYLDFQKELKKSLYKFYDTNPVLKRRITDNGSVGSYEERLSFNPFKNV